MSTTRLLLVTACACTPAFDNVRTCEAFLEDMHCGDFDFATLVDCEVQGEARCDRSGYFACLAENTTCTDGTPHTSGWADCFQLSVCPD